MQVTRRRVPDVRLGLFGKRRLRLAIAGTAALAVAGGGIAYGSTTIFDHQQVGTEYANGLQVSADQVIKPIGDRLSTVYGKFMASAPSPDGRFLAVTSTDRSVAVQIFDLSTYQLVWRAGTAAGVNQKLTDNSVGQEAPTYSPDGKFLWISQTNGVTRFPVNADGSLGTPTSFPIAAVDGHSALPGQSAYSPDGSTLYVAVNGQNRVLALDPATGAIKQTWTVGTAPRQLAFVGSKLYVSNEGGRAAKPGETTMDSYGTAVPADGFRGTSTTGTLSVIDTTQPAAAVRSIGVGLHPTALKVAGNALFVTNSFDDTVSVVDTQRDKVVQTINTQPWAGSKVGYQPNSVTLTKDGHLLVTLGRANAVAVYRYHGNPQEPVDFIGLLPTDYYPAEVTTAGDQVVVTNTRGIDARGPLLSFTQGTGTTKATGHGTHGTTGSLTRFTLPSDRKIGDYTRTVFAQNGWGASGTDVKQATGKKVKAVPVPKRIGDPSTIKHVFLLVKENRTYDQVYGDLTEGNGDATLAQFGAQVTPNQHALAKQFGLYDNTYDIGTNSAEGHNWLMQGDNPEYTESSAGEYVRSYDTEEDVLGHQRSGFLWTAVQQAHKTARNFGEFEYTEGKPSGTWQQYYCASKSVDAGGDPAQLTSPELKGNYGSVIPSLNAISNPTSPPFDTAIPDIYRYQIWKQEFEKNGPANFNMMWLSSDHTGGTADPRAQVADGDLAVGRIVDEISHSKWWKDSAIFVVEDDSQAGADHVDGHRAPIQIISPWAQHGRTDSRFYAQITMVRTIEQILGAQPLNQKLAAATPMTTAFQSKPDYTPFDAVPNQIPLTEGVATPPACGPDTLGLTGAAAQKLKAQQAQATAVPDDKTAIAAQWNKWKSQQKLTGNGARADYAAPELMNRFTWYQTHSWKVPYPGDSQVYAPSEVPGGAIPSPDND
ncbi:bifunctional YncE family protein/alkaline phosphatase family protein [Nocardioides sp. CER19]|uniref:bifunctional YncE family protein/alkaline phosphatase family protein n=1 Tax=Nocardioides sp. CER19 TaxID=3038538 RepID=UPI00244CB4B4|nr:bifunctional YncE family protein/alkaline phosphatase family protein [Nocardioides sp. CER19]MDH2416803.1 bifunctional YncE family protein/alkaline phosphatase family protein [Nocardioides sp. CER19]